MGIIVTEEEKEEFVFISLDGCDARHHHDHQEDQDDQECPPSMGNNTGILTLLLAY